MSDLRPQPRPEPEVHPVDHEDRDVDLRAVLWTAAGLTIVTVVVFFLMWWLLRGFSGADTRRDVTLSPIRAETRQQPPPEPRLQKSPRQDMQSERAEEDRVLAHAAWIDRARGTVRVPIDVAMQVIASRGLAPAVVGGSPAAATPKPPEKR
jgi:hypothetical protein